jgi:hypothetical protein
MPDPHGTHEETYAAEMADRARYALETEAELATLRNALAALVEACNSLVIDRAEAVPAGFYRALVAAHKAVGP